MSILGPGYRVLKFPLSAPGGGWLTPVTVEIAMPRLARILSLQAQGTVPTIWVLVATEELRTEKRRFRIVATGPSFDDLVPEAYVGTVLLFEGTLVLHVFEMP